MIDFEDAGPPRTDTSALSQGFAFASSERLFITGDRSDASRNGTLALYNLGGTITMTKENGGAFDLLSFDVGEGTLEAPSTSFEVIGFFEGGGSIAMVFPLDGVLPDFQTIDLVGYSDLSTAVFEASGGIVERFSLDNIVIPEPMSLSLLIVGAILVVGYRSYRRSGPLRAFLSLICVALVEVSAAHAQWAVGMSGPTGTTADGCPALGILPLFEGQINTTGLSAGTYVLTLDALAGTILHGDITCDSGTVYGYAVGASESTGDTISFELIAP